MWVRLQTTRTFSTKENKSIHEKRSIPCCVTTMPTYRHSVLMANKKRLLTLKIKINFFKQIITLLKNA